MATTVLAQTAQAIGTVAAVARLGSTAFAAGYSLIAARMQTKFFSHTREAHRALAVMSGHHHPTVKAFICRAQTMALTRWPIAGTG